MWAWGGEYGDYTTNEVKINSPQTVEALKFFTQLLNATSAGGKNMTFDEVGSAYFGGQQAAMACNFLAFFPAIAKNPDYGPKTGYFNMPAGPGGRFATLGGQGMSINAHISEPRQQRAKDFIKWFSSRETQEKWAAREGCFTSNLEVMKTDEFKRATPYNFLFEEAFGMMNDFWAVPEFDEMMKVCQREFCAVFQDGKDAAQAVATIQREHEEILKKAGRTQQSVAAK
jgi:multiple sugar transport system substrate-binding protein